MSKRHRHLRPRIGIDLHVVDGIFQGSRTHCLELFSRVIAAMPECDFFLLASGFAALRDFSESFRLPHVTEVEMPHRLAPIRLLYQLPRNVRHLQLSLLHTQYISPLLQLCPTAVTAHDILFESHPQFFERGFVWRSRVLVPYSLHRSAAAFTVSNFSRQQICSAYSLPENKVHVIPNGVDRSRFFPGTAGLEVVQARGLEREKYFLTVGRLEPRKNHTAILRAWAQLPTPRPKLVFVGQRHFRFMDVIAQIADLHLAEDVLILDQVSDVFLPALYRNALALVYPSSAEGFGMPLLEAMASGIPVIASDNTALSEIGANAALLIDPDAPSQISAAVVTVLTQPSVRSDLIRRGLDRAKEYTWEKAAQTVRQVYLETLLSAQEVDIAGS